MACLAALLLPPASDGRFGLTQMVCCVAVAGLSAVCCVSGGAASLLLFVRVRVTLVLLCFGGLGLSCLCVRSCPVACVRVVVPLGVRHASC